MILIAESGSTKTQWCLVDKGHIEILVNTPGINPFILSVPEIESIIRPVLSGLDNTQPEKIYFFGAGCSVPSTIQRIQKALFSIFECKDIEVDTDLKAACLALSGDRPGLIGLLGTGSNSCKWDGKQIAEKIPSLGYVLGDEGGGVSLGKQLIADYLKLQMPEHIHTLFAQKYTISATYVLERVYQTPMPNRYLAGFAPFIEENIKEQYCHSIVQEQFKSYLERNLLLYRDFDQYETYFCGSIAYFHRDVLKELGQRYKLKIKKIVKEPINDLALYFQKELLK